MSHQVSCKKTSCSGPHNEHDCQGCLGPEKCLGWTEFEHILYREKTRLYCMLLDRGLTHDQIRAGAPSFYKGEQS